MRFFVKGFLTSILLIYGALLQAQNPQLDSLKRVMNDPTKADTSRMNAKLKYAFRGFLRENPDSTIFFAEQVLHQAQALGDAKFENLALSTIGSGLFEKGMFEEALEKHLKSLEVSQSTDDTKGIMASSNNLAICYVSMGQESEALHYYEKALDACRILDNRRNASTILNNMGGIFMRHGDFGKAMFYYTSGLKIKEELADSVGISAAHGNIGNLYNQLGDFESAKKHFAISLGIRKRSGDLKGQAHNLIGIATIYLETGKIDKGIACFLDALRIYQIAQSKDDIALTQVSLAQGYTLLHKLDLAMVYADSALALYQEIHRPEGTAVAYHRIGSIQLEMGQVQLALKNFSEALKINRELDALSGIRDAAQGLYQAYKQLGNDHAALEMFELYVTMKDSVSSEDNQRATLQQELNYEFQKAQLLQAQAEKEALELETAARQRRDRLQYIMIGGGVMALLLCMLLLGFLKIPEQLGIAIVFIALLVVFEFLLVLLDPYTDPIAAGQPMIKFVINLALALVLAPLHQILERIVHHRLLKKNSRSATTDSRI